MAALSISRRSFLAAGGVLVVGLGLDGVGRASAQTVAGADRFLGKSLAPDAVDSFLAVHADGSVTLFVGKVDIGTGGRIAMRQIVGEELDVPLERIAMIEGDTALTPNQGATAGSYGIARGGTQLRQAAATARQALLAQAAQRLGRPAGDLQIVDGVVRAKDGTGAVTYGELIGDRAFNLKVDGGAPLKAPQSFRFIGKSLPRPDLPAKVTGRHRYLHDLTLPSMLHARVIRPPAHGATLVSVDESSVAAIGGARVVRIQNFLAVVAEREWDAVRAARALQCKWTAGTGLPDSTKEFDSMRASRVVRDQEIAKRGDLSALSAPAPGMRALAASYRWPIQTHGSIGPSCGVADVRADRATVWSSSQNTHGFQTTCARLLGLERDRVRVIYLDGAGSYGPNGADDAAAEAALLSKTLGKPVRVQWTRQEEHGLDPKGPAQLLELRAAVDADGEVAAWETQAWLPIATANLPNIPLLSLDAAGIPQTPGRSTGLIYQNVDPPYTMPNVNAVVHWIPDAPLRTSAIRAPGKVANTFAVESFVDEIAALARVDPVEFRLRRLTNPRGLEVLRRLTARMGWQPRPSPRPVDPKAAVLTGRGIAYIHYKHEETLVAMGMEVAVERATGRIRVTRVVCAQDCGLMINPDCVQSQLEGNIIQTLSRTLHEEIVYDRNGVTTVDWASYPILTFPEVPALEFELIQRLDQPPLGVGEAASTPVPAALGNAVFDATGVRLRTVPFRADRVKAALARS
ncbi:MAG: xanthine dehydrogenase family protein molybdopterin-binding subunit [Candidatus Rokuibacteriota bacterium]|nr:MAG: xanthine dehydrogenase family protein molybdopterin-binding subunit [Candidatus Rokubacteria bacterium]